MRKPKMGRPKVLKSELKSIHTGLALTPGKRRSLERVAADLGLSISQVLSQSIDETLRKHGGLQEPNTQQ